MGELNLYYPQWQGGENRRLYIWARQQLGKV